MNKKNTSQKKKDKQSTEEAARAQNGQRLRYILHPRILGR